MTIYSCGTLEIDGDKLAATSIQSLIKKGLNHFLGNEQSAKTGPSSKWYKDHVKDSGAEPTDEQVDAALAEFRKGAIEALYAGTVGVSSRGPKVDPMTAALQHFARESVKETLVASGIKIPKGNEQVTFADGTVRTMAEMIQKRIDSPKFGPAIADAAKKKIADDVKRVKKAQEAAKALAENPPTVEALDL